MLLSSGEVMIVRPEFDWLEPSCVHPFGGAASDETWRTARWTKPLLLGLNGLSWTEGSASWSNRFWHEVLDGATVVDFAARSSPMVELDSSVGGNEMDKVMIWRGWCAAAPIAIIIALSSCGGGDEPGQAPTSREPAADSAATDTTERPDDLAEVIESGSYEECLSRAILTIEEDGELAELSGEDVNLTKAASPELIDEMTAVMADCLGTEGVADTVVAEISFGAARTPAETAHCLAGRISGDEQALLRSLFAAIRQERLTDDVVAPTAEHYAACFPASVVISALQPIPLTANETACADDIYRSSPELTAYFRAQSGGPPMSEAERAAFAGRSYECLDVPARLLSDMGGTDELSDASMECLTGVAREFGYLEGSLAQTNVVDFEEALFSCFSDEDMAVLEARS